MRLEVPLTIADGDEVVAPTMPLRLEAIDIKVTAPLFTVARGRVALREVAVSDDIEGAAWTPVPFDPGAAPWSWKRIDPNSAHGARTIHRPASLARSRSVASSRARSRSSARPARPPRPSASAPAWTSPPCRPSSARASSTPPGAAVGDTLAVQTYGRSLQLDVVGAVDAFPPLDPAIPFAVVDGPTLELTRFVEDGSGGAGPGVVARPRPDPGDRGAGRPALGPVLAADAVVEREELTRSLETDPVPLGVIGALGIGALAAMAFASIGFVVSATVSTSERLGEFALLQALGPVAPRAVDLALDRACLPARGRRCSPGRPSGCSWPGSCCPSRR